MSEFFNLKGKSAPGPRLFSSIEHHNAGGEADLDPNDLNGKLYSSNGVITTFYDVITLNLNEYASPYLFASQSMMNPISRWYPFWLEEVISSALRCARALLPGTLCDQHLLGRNHLPPQLRHLRRTRPHYPQLRPLSRNTTRLAGCLKSKKHPKKLHPGNVKYTSYWLDSGH